MTEKKHIDVAIALVWKDGHLLVSRRLEQAHLGGYWEFPGGKLEAGESAKACAEREVLEEVAVAVRARAERSRIVYEYEDRVVTLLPVDCDWLSGEPAPLRVAEVRWANPNELAELRFPPANEPLLSDLALRR